MRLAGLLLIPVLAAAELPKLPEPYQSIAELAQGAPPEFAADALLRLVESGKIADRDARRDLAEQAFRLAANARFRVRMRALPGSAVDTRSGYLAKAYDLKLDALTLQSRAVRDLLAIDKAKARELFQDIARPQLTPLSCDDPLVYDVAEFYQTLSAIANGTFTAEQRAKEEHVAFLVDYITQAVSAAQLAPLARAIKAVNLTGEQREILWIKFNGLLEKMQPDDRSYGAAMQEIGREIGPESRASFEIFQQRSQGCTDDAHVPMSLNGGGAANAQEKPGLTPRIEPYWQSPAAQMILDGAKKLRFSPEGRMYSDADRATREWQQQLTDFLSRMGDWGPGQEKSEADYYHQKCVVYEALIEMVPPGPERDEILNSYMHFIGNSPLLSESPVEWFMHAHSMLERVRATNTGEPAKVLAAFEGSGNHVLALYAALERTFGGGVPAWANPSARE